MKLPFTFLTALQAGFTGIPRDHRYAENPSDSYHVLNASYSYKGQIKIINPQTYSIDGAVTYSSGINFADRQTIKADLDYTSTVGFAGSVVSIASAVGLAMMVKQANDLFCWGVAAAGVSAAVFGYHAIDASNEQGNWERLDVLAKQRQYYSKDIVGLLNKRETLIGSVFSSDEIPDIYVNKVEEISRAYLGKAESNPKKAVETCLTLPFSDEIISQVADKNYILTNKNPVKASNKDLKPVVEKFKELTKEYRLAVHSFETQSSKINDQYSNQENTIDIYEKGSEMLLGLAEKTSYALNRLSTIEASELRVMLENEKYKQHPGVIEIRNMLDQYENYKETPFNQKQIDLIKNILQKADTKGASLLNKITEITPSVVESANRLAIKTARNTNSFWRTQQMNELSNVHDSKIGALKPQCDEVVQAFQKG